MRAQRRWHWVAAALLVAVLAAAARAEIGHDPAAAGLGRPLDLAIGAAALLAVIAVALAFRRTRLAIVRAVATYGRRLGGGRRAPEAEPGDWLMTGTDRDGQPIHLVVAMRRLRRDDQGLVIGRSRQIADIVISDPSVSRRHARVVTTGEGIAVVDLKSKRGTWVGGVRLTPYAKPMAIESGTSIQFGTVTLGVSRA